ncbi:ANTAR domain-containing protein [Pseudonocardia sp. T1-2H]|uniref:ANTAR domain-containing protein n=1 Tax=Pseudonocardia sp. T1-2H TaxID=3128899 RepID=UPI003101A93A
MTTEQEWANDRERFVAEWEPALADGPARGMDRPGPGPLAQQFVVLSEALLSADTVAEVLERVVRATTEIVPGADLVSVTMRDPDDGFRTPVETDPLATRLDELQYEMDEGPCVAATRKEGLGLVFKRDLAAAPDFPRYGPAAAELGVRSVLAVGLFPQGDAPRMGALNLYSMSAGGLDDADRDVALVLAAHASTALAATEACSAADLEAAQLRTALQSRDVIGQAKGILMERRGISAAEAFDVLRAASQSLNVKLATIAETLVSRRADL